MLRSRLSFADNGAPAVVDVVAAVDCEDGGGDADMDDDVAR